MKILHVTHSYWPATYFGGPIFSTRGLCEALARRSDVTLRVVSTDAAGPSVEDRLDIAATPTRYPPGYDVFFAPQVASNFAPRQLFIIWKQLRWANGILLTGTYSFHVIPTLAIARLLRKAVAWSPRGALLDSYRWAGHRRPVSKRLYERLCRWVAGPSTVFVVTSTDEATASRARVGDIPTSIITNGIDVPPELPSRNWLPGGRFRLMSLGRIDPKKGLENLIEAVATLSFNVSLDIYGRGEPAYEARLKDLTAKSGVDDRVRFHGHVDGEAKTLAFCNCDLFVLPSHSENFAMVVAEALAHGVPAVVSRAAPWSDIAPKGAGLWVENTPSSLAAAIGSLKKMDLRAMGFRGREWMKNDFGWDARAAELLAVFSAIHAGHRNYYKTRNRRINGE